MIGRGSLLEIDLKHRVLMTFSTKLIVWAGNKVMRTDVKVNIITNFWIWVTISKGLANTLQRITATNGKFSFGFLLWMQWLYFPDCVPKWTLFDKGTKPNLLSCWLFIISKDADVNNKRNAWCDHWKCAHSKLQLIKIVFIPLRTDRHKRGQIQGGTVGIGLFTFLIALTLLDSYFLGSFFPICRRLSAHFVS